MASKRLWALMVLGGALALVLSTAGKDLWRLATTKRIYEVWRINEDMIGYWTCCRFTEEPAGPFRFWNEQTGQLFAEGWMSSGSDRYTVWAPTGEVKEQFWSVGSVSGERAEPPWEWGVEPQPEPTGPWLSLEMSAQDWPAQRGW